MNPGGNKIRPDRVICLTARFGAVSNRRRQGDEAWSNRIWSRKIWSQPAWLDRDCGAVAAAHGNASLVQDAAGFLARCAEAHRLLLLTARRLPKTVRPVDGDQMRTEIRHVHIAVAASARGRAVVVAMLAGPLVGALLACRMVAAEEAKTVAIDNFTFSAKELTVTVGSTVRWINHDDILHSVVAKDAAFRSKALDTDDVYFFTFTSAGTFDYLCGQHPLMTGTIIVK
jgi:plastocyanin